MVELRLNTEAWQDYAKDHYLSVRVGEVQKLAKMAASRSYKFSSSAVGDRKYGKVEIFRRVGSAVVCIDPKMSSGLNEVDVAFDGSNDTLKFEAEVIGPGGCAKPVASPKKAPSTPKSISQKAMSYLDEHHLEVRLADAMQAVLRERPTDPAAFLAEQLKKNAKVVAKLPTPESAEDKAKQVKANQVKAKQVPPVAKQVADAGPPPAPLALPFRQYYAAHFSSVSFASLYRKFPAAVATPPLPVQAKVQDAASRFRPSMGSFQGSAGRFGGIARCPPKVQIAPAAMEPAAGLSEIPVAKRPSVGTWLVTKPHKVQVAPAAMEPAAGLSKIPVAKRPSVGTWLVTKPYKVPVAPVAMEATARPAAVQVAPVAMEAAARPTPLAKIPMVQLPSVGTWLATRRPPKVHIAPAAIELATGPAPPTKISMAQLPSVGTWLATRPLVGKSKPSAPPAALPPQRAGPAAGVGPVAVAPSATRAPAEESAEVEHSPHIISNLSAIGPAFWGSGMQPCFTFL